MASTLIVRLAGFCLCLPCLGCSGQPNQHPEKAVTASDPSRASGGDSSSAPTTEAALVREPSIEVNRPTFANPVTAAMVVVPASDAHGISRADVWIKLRIAGGHYVYASDEKNPPFHPLQIELKLPSGIEAAGDWVFPAAETLSGHTVYFDAMVAHRALRGTVTAGTMIEAVVTFQACNDDVCFPARTITIFASWVP